MRFIPQRDVVGGRDDRLVPTLSRRAKVWFFGGMIIVAVAVIYLLEPCSIGQCSNVVEPKADIGVEEAIRYVNKHELLAIFVRDAEIIGDLAHDGVSTYVRIVGPKDKIIRLKELAEEKRIPTYAIENGSKWEWGSDLLASLFRVCVPILLIAMLVVVIRRIGITSKKIDDGNK